MWVMSLSAAERFFSLLALVALAGSIAMIVLRIVPSGRPVLARMAPAAPRLALLVTATAMFGSLYFSESQHFEPCKLCWYQRICMFSLVIILLVGNLRRDPDVRWYATPLAGIGLFISVYHYLVEWFPQIETGSCSLTAPCSVPWFREFGFISLSFMAGCGFIAVLALMLLPPKDTSHGQQAE